MCTPKKHIVLLWALYAGGYDSTGCYLPWQILITVAVRNSVTSIDIRDGNITFNSELWLRKRTRLWFGPKFAPWEELTDGPVRGPEWPAILRTSSNL